jgi:hypothetical protein
VKEEAPPRNGSSAHRHLYSICFFERTFVVPDVLLIDAENDEEALAEAKARRSFTKREVWDRHRLVGVIASAH